MEMSNVDRIDRLMDKVREGFTEKEFLGKHFTQTAAMQVENSPDFPKQIEAFLRGKVPETVFEFSYCCKNGKQQVAEASIGLLKENGKQSGIQLLLRDITERKKTEIDLKPLLNAIRIQKRY